MSGLFKTPKAPKQDPKLIAAQERAEARAEAAERELQEQIAARKRSRRTGGLRLLLSPSRVQSQIEQRQTTLGAGG
jgi:hypothetical protein